AFEEPPGLALRLETGDRACPQPDDAVAALLTARSQALSPLGDRPPYRAAGIVVGGRHGVGDRALQGIADALCAAQCPPMHQDAIVAEAVQLLLNVVAGPGPWLADDRLQEHAGRILLLIAEGGVERLERAAAHLLALR